MVNETWQYIITTGIPTLAILIVGFILRSQIRSQNKMLKNYENYISTIDWKAVKEHYEEFKIPAEIEKAEKAINDAIDREVEELTPMVDDLIEKYTQSIRFTITVCMFHLSKEDAQKYINDKMPLSAQYFSKLWAWYDQQNADNQESH